VQRLGGVQWCNVHTVFRQNRSADSKFERKGHTDRQSALIFIVGSGVNSLQSVQSILLVVDSGNQNLRGTCWFSEDVGSIFLRKVDYPLPDFTAVI
jgi:hypothetical protein